MYRSLNYNINLDLILMFIVLTKFQWQSMIFLDKTEWMWTLNNEHTAKGIKLKSIILLYSLTMIAINTLIEIKATSQDIHRQHKTKIDIWIVKQVEAKAQPNYLNDWKYPLNTSSFYCQATKNILQPFTSVSICPVLFTHNKQNINIVKGFTLRSTFGMFLLS